MKYPINTILYAKRWYKHRDGIDKWWMDLCHTIQADGYNCTSKDSVVHWLIARMDDMRTTIWSKNPYYNSFWGLFNDIEKEKWMCNCQGNVIDNDDALIQVALHRFFEISTSDIDEWVKPCEKVLPLTTFGSRVGKDYKDGVWTPISWQGAEMKSDVIERINSHFPNVEEQDEEFINDFEEIEGSILRKNWEDVVVLNGSDSLTECREYKFTGKELKELEHYGRIPTTYVENEGDLSFGAFEHCVNFDNDKSYICRISLRVRTWEGTGWSPSYIYTIKSIREEKSGTSSVNNN